MLDHRRAAFLGGRQAFLERHHVLEAGGILADAAAAGAGEIARVKRLELQHQRKSGRAQQLVFDDVTGDFAVKASGNRINRSVIG